MEDYHVLTMPQQVIYGRNSLQEVGNQASSLGKKALIISDYTMESVGNVKQCQDYLNEARVEAVIYLEVNTEPTDQHVNEAFELCVDENCDVIIALGGGSCIDTAKAVSVMMTNEGNLEDYVKRSFPHRGIPVIAIPTTAGTGSEVTKVTVIKNLETEVKMMLADTALTPTVAIVDPILTLTCPKKVTAATGIDALCHGIEALLSKKAHYITNQIAIDAITLILTNLRRVYEQGNDVDAREKVALGSMLAGMAFSNSSVTLVHGMSRPIGALFDVPHGISNAMLLLTALEYTKESAISQLALIGKIVVKNTEKMEYTKEQLATIAINEIRNLCIDLGITNLRDYGIDKERYQSLLEKMSTDALESGSPGNNPKVPTHEEIMELYKQAYDFSFEKVVSK